MRMFLRTAIACSALAASVAGIRGADAPASVTVYVPVGATLFINGQPTQQMTAVRSFVTPALPAGKRFRYNLEATYTWDAEEVTKRKAVEVTAGATVSVNMVEGETAVNPPEPEAKPEVKPEPKPLPPPAPMAPLIS